MQSQQVVGSQRTLGEESEDDVESHSSVSRKDDIEYVDEDSEQDGFEQEYIQIVKEETEVDPD